MIAYTTSAQAVLRAKIARLGQLLGELEQTHRDMRVMMLTVAKLKQQKEISDDA